MDLHTHFIDKLAFVNGLVAGLALYPQIFNVIYRGAATDFSTLSLLVILANGLVWIIYAAHRGLFTLFIASLLNTCAVSILLLLQ